jgi:phage shock protein A
MKEQMQKIIAGLENDITEAEGIRDTINEKIRDMQRSLATARTAFTVLMTSG